jgi:hypothetical protein
MTDDNDNQIVYVAIMSTRKRTPATPPQPQDFGRYIYVIRGQKVMLDADLAALYGIATKRLNEAVSRNKERFPEDFMFQLKDKENLLLRSQIATSSLDFPYIQRK